MAKEKNMVQPNDLGHFHRDMIAFEHQNRYYTRVQMSCGHVKEVSRHYWRTRRNDATFCLACTQAGRKSHVS